MRHGVIMAGGTGTRLWPLSTRRRPKQLLRLIGGKSLLEIAVGRLRGLIDPSRIFVCTSSVYARQALDELAMLPENQLLGEPVGRDTANAVAFSAAILFRMDPDAVLAVLTADHIIEPIDEFQRCLSLGFQTVEKSPEFLVTFGIVPTCPATGYGYIRNGGPLPGLEPACRVAAFREKPSPATAGEYLASGQYCWNSGMFVWKAASILQQLQRHLPESYQGVMRIAQAWDTPRYQSVLQEVYPALPKISIDYAVLEKAPHVAMIPMPVRWLDVGNWESFSATVAPDKHGHRAVGCDLATIDSGDVLAVSQTEHLFAVIGVRGITLIHTPAATLVCASGKDQNVKQMVELLSAKYGDKYT